MPGVSFLIQYCWDLYLLNNIRKYISHFPQKSKTETHEKNEIVSIMYFTYILFNLVQ